MEDHKVRKVVIAGGGTAGWIAAAMLAKSMGKCVEIQLIESDAIPTVGVGESTIPPVINLHRVLDISEKEFLARVNGTFKLGISFENWQDIGKDYVHSFGWAGKGNWAAGFQHFWLAGQKRGVDTTKYGDYCPEHLAARAEKFAVLPKNGVNYAYHIDAGLYAKFLREISEKYGATRTEGKITGVNLNSQTGDIESLSLESGETIHGDLFIDCTGFRALLIGGALKTEYVDWTHWLPCDRAVAVQTETVGTPVPYTRAIAHECGWRWRIPLQSRMGNGLVYSSQYMNDDVAVRTLTDSIEGKMLNEPRVIKFRTGYRAKHWSKNCVALGLSSGFLEPLESTSIHLIQKGVSRLVQLFPVNGIKQTEIDEYNRQSAEEVENIRDFIILHYHVTDRDDSEFWRYCREMDVPASLRHKIDLFSDSGRVFKKEMDLFGEESWVQVMLGQGIKPRAYHPVVDSLDDDALRDFLGGLKNATQKTVDRLPAHHEFIDYYCKSDVM